MNCWHSMGSGVVLNPTTHPLPLAPQETARYIADVSVECKLEVDCDAYVESFRPFLMDIMFAWSKGASFAEICSMTGVCVPGAAMCSTSRYMALTDP